MLSAMRAAAAPAARKTNRHVTAFGVRVPPELEEVRDYELPHFIISNGDDSEDEYYSHGDGDYDFMDHTTWHDSTRENGQPFTTTTTIADS